MNFWKQLRLIGTVMVVALGILAAIGSLIRSNQTNALSPTHTQTSETKGL